jgi:hypothetical protein
MAGGRGGKLGRYGGRPLIPVAKIVKSDARAQRCQQPKQFLS